MDDTAAICDWMDLLAGSAERISAVSVAGAKASRRICVSGSLYVLVLTGLANFRLVGNPEAIRHAGEISPAKSASRQKIKH